MAPMICNRCLKIIVDEIWIDIGPARIEVLCEICRYRKRWGLRRDGKRDGRRKQIRR